MFRNTFLQALLAALLPLSCSQSLLAHETHAAAKAYTAPEKSVRIGQAPFEYELIPSWGREEAESRKLNSCHAMVASRLDHRLFLLVNDPKRCMIVMDGSGKVVAEWGDFCRSAHGLAITTEAGREVLWITDNAADGKVFKVTTEGEILQTFGCPKDSGLYPDTKAYKPSKTLHFDDGGFAVLDGYGRDYIHLYDKAGTYTKSFGGDIGEGEAKLAHWGPHGGIAWKDQIILGLSDQETLKVFDREGNWKRTVPMPGGNPRDLVRHRDHFYVPHLGDAWPKDRNAAGFISVLDGDLKVVANLGGRAPIYRDGELKRMGHASHLFHHPHGICFDWAGNLYVGQFASNGSWPLKFRPVSDKKREVRIVYLVSSDREEEPAYTAAIRKAAAVTREWIGGQMEGRTIPLADPVVEVIKSGKTAAWFTENPLPGWPKASWGFGNTFEEMKRIKGKGFLVPWETVWVVYSDGPGNSGRAMPGFAYLPENDLLGLVGKHPKQPSIPRWQGGLVHELGHALGMLHPLKNETAKHRKAIMWAGFYGAFPDSAYLTESDKRILGDSGWLTEAIDVQ